MRMRAAFLGFLLTLSALVSRAGQVEDLMSIHLEAIGGADRLRALQSVRMKGRVATRGIEVKMTMLAARPNRVRIANEFANRTLVQVYDGETTPWEYEPRASPPLLRDMPPATARIFMGDAEFDDPLLDAGTRKFTVDYAGTATVDGRKAYKLLLTRPDAPPFLLLLDSDTYFIVRRAERRVDTKGNVTEILTRYADFRPLEGVLMPFRITVIADGITTQDTFVDTMEANPKYSSDAFKRPALETRTPVLAK